MTDVRFWRAPSFTPSPHVRGHQLGENTVRNLSQLALATLTLGLSLGMSTPAAAETGHYVTSNAIDKCQAFTPGDIARREMLDHSPLS